MMYRFADPLWFLLLFLLPLFFIHLYKRKNPPLAFILPFIPEKFQNNFDVKTKKVYLMRKLFFVIIFVCLTISLARPQKVNGTRQVFSEGIDIMLVSDISGSMKALDFEPDDRLEAAKKEMISFIDKRINDRIGMIAFAGVSFMATPLTTDYNVLKQSIEQLSSDMVEDGTAIGMALAMALKKLETKKTKSRIIILLTDGMNNVGEIDPITVATMAQTLGVKIYCIGIGSDKEVPYPVKSRFFSHERRVMVKLEMDEKTLKEIADISEGFYFHCDNPERLKEIYHKIDQMEKVKVKMDIYEKYTEYYPIFIIIVLFLMMSKGVFYIRRRAPLQ